MLIEIKYLQEYHLQLIYLIRLGNKAIVEHVPDISIFMSAGRIGDSFVL